MAKTAHMPNVPVNAGDVIANSNANGVHVVIRPHVMPAKPYPAGYSDDNVHWSVGKS